MRIQDAKRAIRKAAKDAGASVEDNSIRNTIFMNVLAPQGTRWRESDAESLVIFSVNEFESAVADIKGRIKAGVYSHSEEMDEVQS